MRKLVAFTTLAAVAGLSLAAAPKAPNQAPNAEAITASFMQDVLYFLSSDAMEGRNTPSRGFDTAALFIASNLAQWGLTGGGDPPALRDPKQGPLAQFLYHIELQSSQVNAAASSVELAGHQYGYQSDFTSTNGAAGQASGPLVFVGHGYVEHKQNIDPYAGINVRGKILVVEGQPPEMVAYESAMLAYFRAAQSGDSGAARPINALGAAGSDFLTPEQYAAQNGALAVIHDDAPNPLAALLRGPATAAPNNSEANPYPTPPPNVPTMEMTRFQPKTAATVPSIVAKAGLWNAILAAKSDPAARATVTVASDVRKARTEDVVALLEGSDPVLKKQYVIISAHLDHVGIGRALNGDIIYNGADDDGSGSTGLLNLAKAFATGPRPKRSIAFIWHAGEEKGLWGSLYFTRYPTIPLAQVVTDLNMDMIGRSRAANDNNAADDRLTKADEIYVIGPQVSSADLERTMDKVNNSYYKLSLNHFYDRTDDPEQIFYRSDHVNYANQGIPILFFFDGVHVDYHQPGDEPQKIDYQKMEKVARTVYAIGWTLATEATPPRLNAVLPPALVKAMAGAKAGNP
ncbi:MAG TPA: M28 family peptidase [Terriglobales bacterium]|nr:M28 family peptidase [Terriglobales bacterium]